MSYKVYIDCDDTPSSSQRPLYWLRRALWWWIDPVIGKRYETQKNHHRQGICRLMPSLVQYLPFYWYSFNQIDLPSFVLSNAIFHVGKNPDGLPSDNKVFIARKGETVDATIESHIYQVRLKDSLLSSLTFGKARDGGEVAWIDSRLTYQVKLLINYYRMDLVINIMWIGWRYEGFGGQGDEYHITKRAGSFVGTNRS